VRRALVLVLLGTLLASALAAEPPRPLTGRGLENLTAFTRLLSLVRFFHPSDAAAAADWNRVAVAGIGAAEGAADPAALVQALQGFFHPLAPTLRVYVQGQRPEISAELRQPAGGGPFKVVAWRHYGGHFDGTSKVFHDDRIDDHGPPGFGTLVQAVDAAPWRGKRVRLRAEVKADVQPGGYAQLGLRIDRAGGKTGFLDNMADRPIRDPSWRAYEIEGDVAADAERIVVLLVMTGGGKVWLDDVTVTPAGRSGDGAAAPLANGTFEAGETGRQPPGWYFPYESVSAGYHLLLRRGEPCRHGGCVELASDDLATPRIPRPEEVFEADLGGGAAALVPVALWADAGGTLPHVRPGEPPPRPSWASLKADEVDADSRAARLAAVALLWGIQQHLNPELDPRDPDWVQALPAALDGAARAADREAFRRVLSRMLLPLHDVRTAVLVQRDDPPEKTLPLAWAWIEGRLVLTGTAGNGAGNLRPGDLVTTIDGRPAAEALAAVEALTPGPSATTRRWLALELLAAGPAGSTVTLGVERPGGPPFTATLARDAEGFVPDTPLPSFAEPRPGVLYLDLRRTSEEAFEKLIPRLAGARGLVFDVRGRPDVSTVLLSHLAQKTVRSPNWQVPVVMQPDHRGMKWLSTFWSIEPRSPHLSGKAAFLTDGRATGYAETLLAMVESDGLGEIVGAPSGGDDGNPTWSKLPGGWTVRWSEGRTLKQDGSPLHGAGVRPAVAAARTLQGIAAGRDEVVERAVEAVER
jgi:C-terminal processing protease CtpA/Prc